MLIYIKFFHELNYFVSWGKILPVLGAQFFFSLRHRPKGRNKEICCGRLSILHTWEDQLSEASCGRAFQLRYSSMVYLRVLHHCVKMLMASALRVVHRSWGGHGQSPQTISSHDHLFQNTKDVYSFPMKMNFLWKRLENTAL